MEANSIEQRRLSWRLRKVNNDNEPGGTGGEWVGCDQCGNPIIGQLAGSRAVICPRCNGLTQLAGAKQASTRKTRKGGR